MGLPTLVMSDAEHAVYAEIRRIIRGESPHADLTEALPTIRYRLAMKRRGFREVFDDGRLVGWAGPLPVNASGFLVLSY